MAVVPKVSSRKTRRRGSMPAAKTFQTARSATTSGRPRSVAWSVFFEADLEFLQGEPEVGDRGVEPEVAAEVFEGGAGLGPDLGADALALAFGQRGPLVGAGPGFEGRARAVEGFNGPDPRAAHAENGGDLAGGHALGSEGNDAVAELGGERFHRRHLRGLPATIADPGDRRKNEI
jgi:hypothetical protein